MKAAMPPASRVRSAEEAARSVMRCSLRFEQS
jgi:hypothetical protein